MKKITFLVCALLISVFSFGQAAMTVTELSTPVNFGLSEDNSSPITLLNNDYLDSVFITHSNTQDFTSGLSCNNGTITFATSVYRQFDLANSFGISEDFLVTSVEFATFFFAGTGPVNLTVNLYSTSGSLPGATLNLLATTQVVVASANNFVLRSIPINAFVPAGQKLIYELALPTTSSPPSRPAFLGNTAGATGIQWFKSADCGAPNIVDLGSTFQAVMNVRGAVLTGVIDACATDTPRPLGPGPANGVAVSVNNVPVPGVVGEGPSEYVIDEVLLNIQHTWASDLHMVLVSPSGTLVRLARGRGGNNGLLVPRDIVFRDDSPNMITTWTGGAPLANYRAEGGAASPFPLPFAAGPGVNLNTVFAGEPINGNWEVRIFDAFAGDAGTLNTFCIDFIQNPSTVGTPPQIICPLNITVNSSNYAPSPCGAQVFFNNAQAFDAEDGLIPVVQTMGPPTGSIFPIGETIIEFSATDSDGNTSTCQFIITVVDDINPIAVCQDLTVELGESGTVTLDASMLNFGFGFTCTYSVGLYDTFGDGWMGSGSVASLNVIVGGDIVLEGITLQTGFGPLWFDFPVMPGQSIQIQYFTNGTWASENWFEVKDGSQGSGDTIYSTPVNQTPAANHTVTNSCESGVGSSDACGSVSFAFNQEGTMTSMTLDCSNLGENMITMYVIDEGGNAVACNVIVTVEDNLAPVIVCLGGGVPDFTPVTCVGNPGPSSAVDTNLVSFSLVGEGGTQINFLNNCPGVTGLQNQTALSVNLLPGQTYTVNANSWTCGDFQYAAQTYIWIDFNGDGVLTADEVVLTGSQIFVSQGGPSGTAPTGGNAFSDTFTVPANAYQGPVTIRVMTNETTITPLNPCASYLWGSMVDFTANILDPDPVGVPQYFLDASGQVNIPITDLYESVSDNAGACGISVTVGGAGVTACEQSNGGASIGGLGFSIHNQFIVANDLIVEAGTDFILSQIELELLTLAPHPNSTTASVYYYENNGGLPGALIGSETLPVTSSVNLGPWPLNPAGNIHEVVIDVTPFTFEGGAGSDTTYWIGLEIGTENGAAFNTIFMSQTELSMSGNPIAQFDTAWTIPNAARDGIYSFNGTCTGSGGGSGTVFTCADLGFTQVTVTATDSSGNSSSCTSLIEIIDNIAPVLVTQDIVVELGPNGTATVTYQDFYAFDDDGVSLSFDNCGIVTGGVNISSFTCANIGTPVPVTIFVADSSNNTTFSSATVTVVDLLGPAIGCPVETVTVDADENNDYMIPDWIGDGTISITDNCTDPVVIFEQSPAPGTVVGPGSHTITVTAEDEYGNESSCSFELVVEEFMSTEDNLLASSVVMYPNPANEFVYLRNNNAQIALTEAIIYDITGKVITRVDLSQMGVEQRIDISGIATGVYLVSIKSVDAMTVKRLIKK